MESLVRITLYFPAIALGFALAVLAGCQSYEPRPLDPGGHIDAWSSRSPSDESFRMFLDALDTQAHPGSFDLSDGIHLHEAERIALFYNPDLRLARLRAEVRAGVAEFSGRWDDPEFSVDALRVTENVPDEWIIGSSLTVTIPISGRLRAERDRAEASLRAALSGVVEEEWAVRSRVRDAWYEWSATRLREERIGALLGSVSALLGSADRLGEDGELPSDQVSLITIEGLNLKRAHQRLRADGFVQEQRLRALMGLSPEPELRLIPSLSVPDPIEVPDHETLIENHPTLVKLRDEYEVAEATLLREIRAQYPDLTIGPMYESDQGQSRIGFVGGIPLPILNSNARGIAEARGERALARARYETALERVLHDIAVARARVEQSAIQRAMYESEIVPLVDRQFEDAQRLLDLGESDGMVLLESITRAGETSMEMIETRLEESRAANALRTLVGPDPRAVSSVHTTNTKNEMRSEVQP